MVRPSPLEATYFLSIGHEGSGFYGFVPMTGHFYLKCQLALCGEEVSDHPFELLPRSFAAMAAAQTFLGTQHGWSREGVVPGPGVMGIVNGKSAQRSKLVRWNVAKRHVRLLLSCLMCLGNFGGFCFRIAKHAIMRMYTSYRIQFD